MSWAAGDGNTEDENDYDDYIESTLPELIPESINQNIPKKKRQIDALLKDNPLLLSIPGAVEVDVDAISDERRFIFVE